MEILGMSIGFTVTVALVLVAIWFIKGDKPESLTDLGDQLGRAERLARIAVAGAQQRAESGQIPRAQRYAEVEDFLLETFPDLHPDQARLIIESAVYWFKKGRSMLQREVEWVEETEETTETETTLDTTPRPTGA